MRVSDSAKYYGKFLAWWRNYKIPAIPSVLMPLISNDDSGFVLRNFADENTLLLTIKSSNSVFMARSMFLMNDRDRACFASVHS